MEDLLKVLNEAQQKGVVETQGPVMILAGPGSGKTRVLTHRIAWLIENGVDPFRILALTFTNKAAKEMKERVAKLLKNNDPRDVWMGTFHSVFARILRIEAARLGYTSSFTIYDTDDSKSVLRQILKENSIDEKAYPLSAILHRISSAKMSLFSPTDYNKNSEIQADDLKAQKPLIGHIYTLYWNRCRRSNAMDFDDILYNMNVLVRDFDDLREKYQNKFQYVLVDEYQDTCFSQYVILKKLAFKHRNLCVVGDDAQGIYAFRGAKIENILNFSKDFPESNVIKLEQNYRSTKVIVEAANSIISFNENQLNKKIWTDNTFGEKIKVLKTVNDNEEAISIAQDIFHTKMNNQCENNDFAVLYRTNAQSRALEEAFRKLNIPYRIFGSLSFYKRKEIKDLMGYFRLTINANDEEAVTRVINTPARGIGKTTIDRLIVYAHENNLTLWEVIENIKQYKADLNNGAIQKIDTFAVLIKSFRAQLEKMNAYELADHILKDSGYLNMLKVSDEPESAMRIENIEELLNAIKSFVDEKDENDTNISLSDFLIEVSLLTDLDDENEDNNKVALMTVHSAKGLEFPYVYVSGLEENLFPSSMSLNSRSDIEEERRLFYVAVTRAMKRVTLSYAESRLRWGKREITQTSRFIEEIDENLLDLPRKKESIEWSNENDLSRNSFERKSNFRYVAAPAKPNKPISESFKKINKEPNDSSSAEKVFDNNQILPGVTVEHEKFGKGKVLQVDGDGTDKKAIVFFPAVGKKNLLLKFAKLSIIN